MGIDTSMLAYPKGALRVEVKREKRLTDAQLERVARALVRRRDHGKCVVPGCKDRAEHLHHIVYRARSKRLRWATSNLASLCPSHHQFVHSGRIQITGNADEHLTITGDKRDLSFKL